MQPQIGQCDGDETAQHDEFALGDVDNVHHPPDQGQPVSGQREQPADQKTVDQQLNVEDRSLEQDLQIIHVLFPGTVVPFRPPASEPCPERLKNRPTFCLMNA